MFKKRMFHQRNTTQTAQDAEFVQSTPKQPINIGKGLKIVPIFFLVMLIVFTPLHQNLCEIGKHNDTAAPHTSRTHSVLFNGQ